MVLLHHIQRVQVWDWLEGVESHQGASSMSVKHLHAVPGLQTFQHYKRKEDVVVSIRAAQNILKSVITACVCQQSKSCFQVT